MPSRSQLFGDWTEIYGRTDQDGCERAGGSVEEDRAAPLRSGVQRSSLNPQVKRRCGPRRVAP